MILTNVMDEIAKQLDTIDGLRVYAWAPGSVVPPAAVVLFPESYTYDETYGRGADRMKLPVAVMVGRASERTSRDLLSAYLDGSGPKSIKRVAESGLYSAVDALRVTGVDIDVMTMGGTDYWGAVFQLDIIGSGS